MCCDTGGDALYYGGDSCRNSEGYVVELLAPEVPIDDLPRDVDDSDAAGQEGFPAGVRAKMVLEAV